MLRLTKTLVEGQLCPRFYGLYRYDFLTGTPRIAVIPLNIFLALGIHGWQFLRGVWRSICLNSYDAFQQGVDHGTRMALKSLRVKSVKAESSSNNDKKAPPGTLSHLFMVFAIGMFSWSVVACGPMGTVEKNPVDYVWPSHISLYVDPTTRCQYLVFEGGHEGGITPRINAAGKPICGLPRSYGHYNSDQTKPTPEGSDDT